MHSKRLCLNVGLLISFLSVANLSAADIPGDFSSHAQQLQEKGDWQGALLDFSRSLLLDRTNQDAIDGLLAISANAQVPAATKLNIYLLQDLLNFHQSLQKEMAYLENLRKALLSSLKEKGVSPPDGLSSDVLSGPNSYTQSKHELLSSTLVESATNDPIVLLNETISRENESLSDRIHQLKDEYDRLSKINKLTGYSADDLRSTADIFYKNIASQYGTANSKAVVPNILSIGDVDQRLSDEEGIVKSFAQEIQLILTELAALKEQAQDKDKRVEEMKNQIVAMSLKFAEQKGALEEKAQDIESIQAQYIDLKSRFEFSQNLINEKDAQIEKLEQKFASIQERSAADAPEAAVVNLSSKNNEINKLQQILDQYKSNLLEASRSLAQKDEDIASLKDEMKKISVHYAAIKDMAKGNEAGSVGAAGQILDEQKSAGADSAGIKEIKKDLAQAHQEIKKKDRSLELLNKQLSDLQNKIKIPSVVENKGFFSPFSFLSRRSNANELNASNEKLRELIRTKVNEINEINGILQVYKGKLADVYAENKQNVDRIEDLENKLALTQEAMIQKDSEIAQLKANYEEIQKQLFDIQNQVKGLGDSVNNQNHEFKDLNRFLNARLGLIE